MTDGVLQGQVDIPGGGLDYSSLAYAGPCRVMAFRPGDGHLALIDYIDRKVLWQSRVEPFAVAAYDSRHNLVVTIKSDYRIRIYLTTPIPAILSSPAFNPVPAQVNRLAGYVVRTRLTGDMDEPCSGYRIKWSLAPSAKGCLEKASSKTGADGYADNFYFGQNLGDETVQVEVSI